MTDLIAEDLLLLLLDDDDGTLADATYLDLGIGGALLVELALAGYVEVVEGSGLWNRRKIHPVPGASPTDSVLHDALGVVGEKERSAQDLVTRLGRKRRGQLLERLEEKGILEREQDKVLGLFPRTRWPALDSAREAEVRRRLGDALVRGQQPDERTAALVALLSSLGLTHKVVEAEGLSKGELKKRAKAIAEGDWAAKAVKDAVTAAQTALTAAVVTATVSASSGSSS